MDEAAEGVLVLGEAVLGFDDVELEAAVGAVEGDAVAFPGGVGGL